MIAMLPTPCPLGPPSQKDPATRLLVPGMSAAAAGAVAPRSRLAPVIKLASSPVIRDRDFTVATIVSSSGYLEEQLLAKQKEAEAAAAALAGTVPIEGAPVEGAEGAAAPGAAAPAEGAAAPAADAKGGDKGKK